MAVRMDKQLVFANKKGEVVIGPWLGCDGLGCFYEGMAAIRVDGRWGYVDKKGKVVISPAFDYSSKFSEGRAYVLLGGWLTGEICYIDKDGGYVWRPPE